MELNRVERRALLVASSLVVLGAAVRVGVGPGEATWAWRSEIAADGDLDSMRVRVESEIARAERIATPLAAGETLDPNLAPEEELQRLPGIGPSKAAAIVQARRDGPFLSADGLLRVPGLGPVTVERLAPHLDFGSEPAPRHRVEVPAQTARVSSGPLEPEPGLGPGLDLNTAGTAALERLPGLGPVRAQAIVTHRARHGPFRTLAELTDVTGIGPALLKRLRPHLIVR